MKSPAPPSVTAADTQLFRDAVGSVRPLRHGEPEPPPRVRPRPARLAHAAEPAAPLSRLLGPGAASDSYDGDLHYLLTGLDPALLRRLKRGRCKPQDEIDLHHLGVAEARSTLLDFLEESCHSGLGCVRIIHGKGLRSPMGGPILKIMTDQLLRLHDQVLAFASARPEWGGSGAVIVLLRAQ